MRRAGWKIHDERANSTGVYYTINVRTQGAMEAPVTVKHSTRHDKMVCLTHHTADQCEHSQFVREYIESLPTPKSA